MRDAADLSHVPKDSKEGTIIFGVTPYMNDEQHVERAAKELIRIIKPRGWVFVAENNELARKELADSMRK